MSLIKNTLDFMFPHSCLICGGLSDLILGKAHVCKSCMSSIFPIENTRRWNLCIAEPFDGDKYPGLPLYVPFAYQGQLIHMIYGLKFGGKKDLGELIGLLLGKCIKNDEITADLVIPIPLSEVRMKERGYNQADLIASTVARVSGIPYASDVLIRTKNTSRQAECKNNEERFMNVRSAFALNSKWDITGATVILIDDVVTTGNTMHEAACVLLDCGAMAVLCCAFASSRMSKELDI